MNLLFSPLPILPIHNHELVLVCVKVSFELFVALKRFSTFTAVVYVLRKVYAVVERDSSTWDAETKTLVDKSPSVLDNCSSCFTPLPFARYKTIISHQISDDMISFLLLFGWRRTCRRTARFLLLEGWLHPCVLSRWNEWNVCSLCGNSWSTIHC
jgi:hypothetical protein